MACVFNRAGLYHKAVRITEEQKRGILYSVNDGQQPNAKEYTYSNWPGACLEGCMARIVLLAHTIQYVPSSINRDLIINYQ